MSSDDNDEPIKLSEHALKALAEFTAERDAHQVRVDRLKVQLDNDGHLSMDAFAENWNDSQFWYSDETAQLLAGQLLLDSSTTSKIGVISAPSVFIALRNMLRCVPVTQRPTIQLLEFDQRFQVFTEFVHYDFQQPLRIPSAMKGSFDCIICDPPFLSEDCQTKAAITAKWLLKAKDGPSQPRLIVCTGERMGHVVTRLYRSLNLHATTYEPRHAGGLSNEFSCFANFESTAWKWKKESQ